MKLITTAALFLLLALPSGRAAIAADADPAAVQTTSSATMDLRELIFDVGKRSHLRFLIDPRVNAKVDMGGIAARDVTYPILLSILQLHGFAAISESGIVMVVVDANVRTMAPPQVSPDNIKGEDADIVTTIIPLGSANAAVLASTLRPMVAQYGFLAPITGRNALVLTDRVVNVKRLVNIIREVDKLQAQEPKQ